MREFMSSWNSYVVEDADSYILTEAAPSPETLNNIHRLIRQNGGKSFIVGGAVRDELIPDAPEPKDIDFVVTGIPLDDLEKILSALGKVSEVGKSFGIIKAVIDGDEYDFSIPRTEKKTGTKHTDFDIVSDHTATVEDDMARRDFTMNALSKDSEGNIIDIFGGVEDIQNKVIRTVGNPDERFAEDPLRILRAIQFAVRLDFDIEEKTKRSIKNNFHLLRSIAVERIFMEFEKAWTKGRKDSSHLIELLKELGIGEFLFGFGFEPLEINPPFVDTDESMLTNFVAFFLRGGEPERMRPTKEMSGILNLAKQIAQGNKNIWEMDGVSRGRLQLLHKLFKRFGLHYQNDVLKIALVLGNPINNKELDITGHDIMKLGFSGGQVGSMLKAIISVIQTGEIQNNHDDIVNFMERV